MKATDITDYALYSRIKDLPSKEQRIAAMVVERLHAGLKEYGPWDRRKHDNIKDMLEEQLDFAAYSSAAILELMDEDKGTG